jgi:hypothetical protein
VLFLSRAERRPIEVVGAAPVMTALPTLPGGRFTAGREIGQESLNATDFELPVMKHPSQAADH